MGILRSDVVSHSSLESTGSVAFDGTGDWLSIPDKSDGTLGSAFHFTGDYTIDFWIRFNTLGSVQRIFGQRNADGSDIGVLLEWDNSLGKLMYYYSTNGSTTYYFSLGGTSDFSTDTWYHIAILGINGLGHGYRDGVFTEVGNGEVVGINHGDSTFSIGRQGQYTANPFNGYISNFRIRQGAHYKNNFTVPQFESKVEPGTILLCCQSSSSTTEFAAAPYQGTITANGDPTASSFAPDIRKDITDTGVVFEDNTKFDTLSYMVPSGGTTTERGRGRALYAGGYKTPNTITAIDLLQIQHGGITNQFGDLTATSSANCAACSSSTRMVTSGGWASPVNNNVMEYVTIAVNSNATDFGDLDVARRNNASVSNQTRGLVYGGNGTPANTAQVDYFTIATTGDAADFGDASSATAILAASASSSTRALFAGGYTPSAVDTIDYFTIASTGNYTDFGNLDSARKGPGGLSSSTRSVFGGGGMPSAVNTIDYVTTASLGDASDFGDLFLARAINDGTSNGTRGIWMGGTTNPARQDTIDSVTIATTGNAVDWGNFRTAKQGGGASSDSHGGLS